MEDSAQRVLLVGAEMAAEEDEQVDVRMERQLPPPVAADGDDRQRLGRLRRRGDDLPEDGVEAIRKARERGAAAVTAQDLVTKLAASLLELPGEACRGAGNTADWILHGSAPH